MPSTSPTVPPDGSDGPLAEFSALRDEIQERVKSQQHMLSLQITLTGAVFGFAISRAGMTPLLLIVPFSSYLLCGRLTAHHFGTLQVAKYIREELHARVPGGLGWERWLLDNRRAGPHFLGSTLPLLLTFPGASILALGWTSGYVFVRDGVAGLPRFGLIVVWILAFGASALSAVLILQMSGRMSGRTWERTGLS